MPVIKATLRSGTSFFSIEFELEASLTSGLVLLAFGTSSLLAIVEREPSVMTDNVSVLHTYVHEVVVYHVSLEIKWRNPGRFLLHMVYYTYCSIQ